MPDRTLIIRADASISIATGHVMRCLALAQAWQSAGGNVIFAMAESTPAIERRLRAEGMEIAHLTAPPNSVQDARDLSDLARQHGAVWAVVDGYPFDSSYQLNLKTAGLKLLCVDDLGQCRRYVADIVLNQNAHACERMYANRESNTSLLRGPRYAMLRREFSSWSDWRRPIVPNGRHVLVMMGGSDPDNVTLRAIDAMRHVQVAGLEVVVVAGGSNPHIDSLERSAKQSSVPILILRDVSRMAELMARADVAVSAAGATCAEVCLLGLPTLLIDVAENQRPVAEDLGRRRVAIHLGSGKDVTEGKIAMELKSLMLSTEARASLSRTSRELVDGEGAARVMSAMRGENLRLRRAREKDCRWLWELANDPEVRSASFSSDPISWEWHLQWFNANLRDPNFMQWVAVDNDDVPCGQLRYELEGSRAVVSISLALAFRGRGHGKSILAKAAEDLFRTTGAVQIDAYVKTDNAASIGLFTSEGYVRSKNVVIDDQQAAHFILKKPADTTNIMRADSSPVLAGIH